MTLGYLASITSEITLGALVLGNGFRPINQLARETAALADALPGRFILGLGCGSQPVEHEAFGLPFRRRVGRLESTLENATASAEREACHSGRRLYPPSRREQPHTTPVPPVWIAGFGPRMLRLAATHAAGWNSAWHGPDTSVYGAQLDVLRADLDAAGRSRDKLHASVGLSILPVQGVELDRLAARIDSLQPSAGGSWPLPATEEMLAGSASRIAESIHAYQEVGADYPILNLSPAPFSLLDESLLERAGAVLRELE